MGEIPEPVARWRDVKIDLSSEELDALTLEQLQICREKLTQLIESNA